MKDDEDDDCGKKDREKNILTPHQFEWEIRLKIRSIPIPAWIFFHALQMSYNTKKKYTSHRSIFRNKSPKDNL